MTIKTERSVTSAQVEELDVQLREEFILGAEKFASNPLHQKLKSDDSIQDKLKFIPRMLFFVLGFKDVMQLVRYEGELNELKESVNTHSDEDSNHWEWYLNDLAFMSGHFKEFQGADLISKTWADETLEVRRTIYSFNRYVQQYDHPVARMLMIEVLEITFDKFKAVIHPVLKNADLYDQLEYFGKKHQETEENHSTGISDDEIAHLINLLPDEMKEDMVEIVRDLFNQMYRMTSNWAQA